MKQFLIVLLLSVIVCAPARAQKQLVDAIAAVVGQEVILVSDVQWMTNDLRELARNSSQEVYEREAKRLMAEALEGLIETNILYREALRAGLEVPEERLEETVQDFFDEYETEEAAMADLRSTGYTVGDLRDRERKRLLAGSMMARKVESLQESIVISETEIVEYYEENIDEYERPERVRLRQIMLRAPQDSDEREAAVARMEVLREEIVNGASFQELANKYSEIPSAEDGGILPFLDRGALLEELDAVAFSIEPGEVSEVLTSRFGVHLLKVEERQPAGKVELNEARADIEPKLRQRIVTERLNNWVADLRKISNVRVYL